jgi:hypothetical protein
LHPTPIALAICAPDDVVNMVMTVLTGAVMIAGNEGILGILGMLGMIDVLDELDVAVATLDVVLLTAAGGALLVLGVVIGTADGGAAFFCMCVYHNSTMTPTATVRNMAASELTGMTELDMLHATYIFLSLHH